MNRLVAREPLTGSGPRLGKMVAIAVVTALVLAGAGCGGDDREAGRTEASLPAVEGSPPTPEQLIGTWREGPDSSPAFVRFDRDGTFAIDTDKLDVPYFAAGTYELEGDTIAFESNGPDCASSWEWQVGIVTGEGGAKDELEVVFLNAWCQQLRGAVHRFARA